MTGITVQVDQPELVIEVSDSQVVLTSGVFQGISLDTLNLQGPAGQGAFQYVHDQAVASTVWTINHSLNGRPNVTAVDAGGTVLYGTVDYVSDNQVTVTHSAAYAGAAYLT